MAHSTEEVSIPQQFPASVRVLVVDHDITLLNFIKQICIRCHYSVTTCSQVLAALLLLRERKGGFDVILVDVHMPDMDGYYLLQRVSQEWKIPVIMMSTDATTSAVMKAIKHGACDYWIKPLQEEQFRNMWQHVARKAISENKQDEILGMMEVVGGQRKRDHSEFASTEGVTNATKDSASKEAQICVVENEKDKDSTSYPPPAKKSRRVWSPELHQEFVKAVRQLGPDEAVPKRIVEVMKVPGLTREHVASHLQKYRHYLKKSVEKQQDRMPKEVPGTIESKVGGSERRFEFQNGNPQVPNTARNFPQSNMIIDDLSSRYGATHSSTVPLQQLPHQQPVLNLQINSFNSLNYVNPASSINQIFGFNRNSFDSDNPFIIPQFFHPPVRQQLPNSDLRNATLRSSPSLSTRPTGLEMVSSPDIDNINTSMEVQESTGNSPDEDQPFS